MTAKRGAPFSFGDLVQTGGGAAVTWRVGPAPWPLTQYLNSLALHSSTWA